MKDSVDFAFLDSGTGGIPYMKELKRKLPSVRCVYLGDTAHFPYGQKTSEEVTECAASSIKKIVGLWNPRVLIIACNTISVTALDELRALFPSLPIVGTVPAIRLAARKTRNHKIGLLATNATVRHPYCTKLMEDFASDCQVFNRGDPDLIYFIEHSLFTASKEERLAAVRPSVDYFLSNGCDTIILGCTHFTHMAGDIAEAAGNNVVIVDSRDGVANQAINIQKKLWENAVTSTVESLNKEETCDSVSDSALPADKTFFVTRCRSEDDEKEYATLCKAFGIPWGGEI
ncbi:MAG: glutamate racemase [Treponema sp.]|nr:glutamate racemase [Treponema sp.]